MMKPIPLRRPRMTKFCPECLDETKCDAAEKCLTEARMARDLADSAPIVPLKKAPPEGDV